MDNKKRDNKKEYQRQKEINKVKHVKIPIEEAKELEKKLKSENKTFTELVRQSIRIYLGKF